MKTMQLMAAALCAVAFVNTASFADDNGLEPATPPPAPIADPVNPQPGMIFSAYEYNPWMMADEPRGKLKTNLTESPSMLLKMSAARTGVDRGEKFTIDCAKGVEVAAIRWEGFLKCSLAKTFTFVVQKNYEDNSSSWVSWSCGYAVAVNGKCCCSSFGQTSFDVNLKVGFNKIEIVCLFPDRWGKEIKTGPLVITARPKDSIAEPTKLSPGMLFYDDRPELHETGL